MLTIPGFNLNTPNSIGEPAMKQHIVVTFLLALMLSVSATAQETRKPVSDGHGNYLTVRMNSKTGSAHRVYGQLPNIRQFGFQRDGLTKESISNLSSTFFSAYQDILNIDPDQVKLEQADTDGQLWFVLYRQAINDIPVYGTQIGYTVNQTGDIIALGADAYQNLKVSTSPSISKEAAQNAASTAFGVDSAEVLGPGVLTIYPVNKDSTTTFYLT